MRIYSINLYIKKYKQSDLLQYYKEEHDKRKSIYKITITCTGIQGKYIHLQVSNLYKFYMALENEHILHTMNRCITCCAI